jgi:hypothetical protein
MKRRKIWTTKNITFVFAPMPFGKAKGSLVERMTNLGDVLELSTRRPTEKLPVARMCIIANTRR